MDFLWEWFGFGFATPALVCETHVYLNGMLIWFGRLFPEPSMLEELMYMEEYEGAIVYIHDVCLSWLV